MNHVQKQTEPQTLLVRKIPFQFSDDIPPVWHPLQHEWSHMLNGASLTMPYLEPFLNRTLRSALQNIEDPELRDDVDGFVRQEAQHYQNHRRYNEMLKRNGYEELVEVERTFEADYRRLDTYSLDWRLAYAAGFETMTMGITEWLVNDRGSLFYQANPTVTSLVLWHMVEETEHKAVAYDVYQTVSGKYWLRLAGLFLGSLHVGLMSRRAYKAMLVKDGLWANVRSRMRLWKMVGRFFVKAGGAMVRAMRPGYHPNKVEDPLWVKLWVEQWQTAFAGGPKEWVPLLDTTNKAISPTFKGQSCRPATA